MLILLTHKFDGSNGIELHQPKIDFDLIYRRLGLVAQ